MMVYPDARRMLQYNITVLFLSAKRGWNWFSASVSSSSFTSFLQKKKKKKAKVEKKQKRREKKNEKKSLC